MANPFHWLKNGSLHPLRLSVYLTGTVGLIVLTAFSVELFSRGVPSPTTWNLSRGREFVIACRTYAVDHDGRLPLSKSDLIPKYIETAEKYDSLRYKDPETKVAYDWVRYVDQADPTSGTITYSSPLPVWTSKDRPRRVVFRADASGAVAEEIQFTQELAAQMRALSAKPTPLPIK